MMVMMIKMMMTLMRIKMICDVINKSRIKITVVMIIAPAGISSRRRNPEEAL